ncbi:MAG: sulfurtransferase [Verrucomicrobia bacterium]|nr:MAG: sulfurtransferase [Verrucomicrobiota bacterium]
MSRLTQFLVDYGQPLVFASVLVEQLGLPIPALPVLLAAGALAATGKFNLLLGILLTTLACIIADLLWFYLGRYRGNRVLNFLCKISLEPDSCVRRTQNVFTRYGLRGIAIAKFVPGMSTVAPPLAGMSGLPVSRFLLADGSGSVLYAGILLGLGFVFSKQIDQIGAAISQIGGSALELIGLVAAIFIAYKFWQRRVLIKELRTARISVAELHGMVNAGQKPVILDMRSQAELQRDPSIIQGAVHLLVDEVEKRRHEFPRDRDIVVYCSCPNEATAARVSLMLQRHGFTRVRPLLGGLDAWREQNYPLDIAPSVLVSAVAPASPALDPVSAHFQPTPQSSPGDRAHPHEHHSTSH